MGPGDGVPYSMRFNCAGDAAAGGAVGFSRHQLQSNVRGRQFTAANVLQLRMDVWQSPQGKEGERRREEGRRQHG